MTAHRDRLAEELSNEGWPVELKLEIAKFAHSSNRMTESLRAVERYAFKKGYDAGKAEGIRLAEEILVGALNSVDKTLTVLAAEYVPAIGDAFTVIDKALAEWEKRK